MCCSKKSKLSIIALISLFTTLLLFNTGFHADGQTTDQVTLSYEAFTKLAHIYNSGGQASGLVSDLNLALDMMQEAKIKQAQGDIAGAQKLEDQANSTLLSVVSALPAVQEQADRDYNNRILATRTSIAIVVAVSTLAFYVMLRTRRYNERTKLYKMRIVEKNAES